MAEETPYTSEELLNQLLNNTTDSIYFKDLKSRFILINQACIKKHGWASADAIMGKTDFDTFTREHAEQAYEDEQKIIKTGEPLYGIEEKETFPDGHEAWVSTSKMPLRDADGNIIGTFGISRDITEHKLGEIKLHQYANQLTQINKQMEEDLRMAANLQQAFLPQFYPNFPAPADSKSVQFAHRYISNTPVSGDLCSIHKLSDTEAGMLICDVMGHGVRAALITAIVYAMIGDLTRRSLSPGDFFSELNRQLRPIFQSQDAFIFVTASYLILNTETGNVRGASAGHTTPFLIHDGEPPLHAAPLHAINHVNGPALAVVENFEYKTVQIQLDAGDTVLMYTDGLLEEINKEGEEFGMTRAREVLQKQQDNGPKVACDSLVDAVNEFNSGAPLTDDVCLLAFRWNGSSN
ncbi:MAG: SpoIIE family protein phosphatase [Verrucomicrobia bacterium]|nr:SpoIIE family protein phosphatase [Verrucomicrobiota bacterium]